MRAARQSAESRDHQAAHRSDLRGRLLGALALHARHTRGRLRQGVHERAGRLSHSSAQARASRRQNGRLLQPLVLIFFFFFFFIEWRPRAHRRHAHARLVRDDRAHRVLRGAESVLAPPLLQVRHRQGAPRLRVLILIISVIVEHTYVRQAQRRRLCGDHARQQCARVRAPAGGVDAHDWRVRASAAQARRARARAQVALDVAHRPTTQDHMQGHTQECQVCSKDFFFFSSRITAAESSWRRGVGRHVDWRRVNWWRRRRCVSRVHREPPVCEQADDERGGGGRERDGAAASAAGQVPREHRAGQGDAARVDAPEARGQVARLAQSARARVQALLARLRAMHTNMATQVRRRLAPPLQRHGRDRDQHACRRIATLSIQTVVGRVQCQKGVRRVVVVVALRARSGRVDATRSHPSVVLVVGAGRRLARLQAQLERFHRFSNLSRRHAHNINHQHSH